MKIWLKNKEFVPFAPEVSGTVHIHHCKSGYQNDRLYITRKEDDTILAHCFHCGARGSYSVAGDGTISRKKRASQTDNLCGRSNDSTGLLVDSRNESIDRTFSEGWSSESRRTLSKWPLQARKWWLECGLTIPEQEAYRVTYNEDENALDLPIFNRGDLVGLCRKSLPSGKYTSKYMLVGDSIGNPFIERRSGRITSEPIVIVEDYRSAIKVARITTSYPLFGTNLLPAQLIKILECKASKAFVFLDNDNTEVKRKALEINKRLNIYLPSSIIDIETDPKNLSEEELRKLIT